MSTILNIILALFLCAIVYQDFKFRTIHFFLVVGVFIIGAALLLLQKISITILFYNFIFLIVVMVLLWLYMAIKNRNMGFSLNNSTGIGDILFFFPVVPLFSLRNYMLFFISGMLVSMTVYFLFQNTMKKKLVPLAGILSAYILILRAVFLALDFDIFYNKILN